MKKILLVTLLFSAIFMGCESKVSAQQGTAITYRVRNGYFQVLRGTTSLVNLSVLDCVVDTVQFAPSYAYTLLKFTGNGRELNIRYAPARDSMLGFTAVQARDAMNQSINAAKGNYLGAYKYSELKTGDTSFIGNYYYDTDTATFRFKRAVGGFQSVQPKN
jgi:hypothetical protein